MSTNYAAQNDEFAVVVMQAAATFEAERPATFPYVTYDADGDCIEFIVKNESYYAERVDALVTVYYGQETNEIVGSLIKGVNKFLQRVIKRAPGFVVELHDGRIKLQHFFTARLWSGNYGTDEKLIKVVYNQLRDVANEYKAEAVIGDLAFSQ